MLEPREAQELDVEMGAKREAESIEDRKHPKAMHLPYCILVARSIASC